MKIAGIILIVLGLIQMVWAGSLNVALPGSDVVNADLLQQRLLVFLGGGFAFGAGWTAIGAHVVRRALQERLNPPG